MSKIKILPKNLINLISAGEVIERPASAVKELVENSIDANAQNITLYIRNGGKTEISIFDDGDGISSEDLELAVLKHATSKIKFNRLDHIETLGFRGEALSSIGSISKMKISSKTKEENCGYQISVDYGKNSLAKPINKTRGTTIIVRDMFFSTPARLKFLKSENYENIVIKNLVQKLALSNIKVSFKLFINDKIVFKSKYESKNNFFEALKKRITDIFGEFFFTNLILLDKEIEPFYFKGFIGVPTFHASTRSNQHIFVNNRIINDNIINQTVKFSYRDLIPYNRFPQLIFFVNLPSSDLDVNVHPSKSEVRFKDTKLLRKSIIKVINETLIRSGHKSSFLNSEKTLDIMKNNVIPNNSQQKINLSTKKTLYTLDSDNRLIKDDPVKKNKNQDLASKPLGYAKGQFHKNYIISQTQDGIIVTDQHAAHERIVYEKLKKNFYSKRIETQILLLPEIIKLDKNLIDVVEDNKMYLSDFGLVFEKFGNDSIIVREIPSILSGCNINQLATDIINEIIENESIEQLEKKINQICSKMACYGSIRSGREMEIEEMNNLLRNMEETPFSGQCNHGRPTYIELKLGDIEKLFGRK